MVKEWQVITRFTRFIKPFSKHLECTLNGSLPEQFGRSVCPNSPDSIDQSLVIKRFKAACPRPSDQDRLLQTVNELLFGIHWGILFLASLRSIRRGRLVLSERDAFSLGELAPFKNLFVTTWGSCVSSESFRIIEESRLFTFWTLQNFSMKDKLFLPMTNCFFCEAMKLSAESTLCSLSEQLIRTADPSSLSTERQNFSECTQLCTLVCSTLAHLFSCKLNRSPLGAFQANHYRSLGVESLTGFKQKAAGSSWTFNTWTV